MQARLTHASGRLAMRHRHPGDWLGRPDSLTARASAGGGGTYHNPLVDASEHFVEPWSGVVECRSVIGEATTDLRVEASCACRIDAVHDNVMAESNQEA